MPLAFAKNKEQLIESARRFDSYREAERESEEWLFWRKMMSAGKAFLHLHSQNGDIFCPGRFAGYKENTWQTHQPEGPGDHDTSRRVSGILGIHESSPTSENALRDVFERNDLEFSKKERTFWTLREDSKFTSTKNEGNRTTMQQPIIIEKPLNRIFYGPPGTGKTYHTVNAALEILDPSFYEKNEDDRGALQQRFEELKAEKRIEFLTFHQSFSYEEFVEGLKATTDESGQIAYEVQAGVFKRLSDRAHGGKAYLSVERAIEKLKEDCSEEPIEMETVHHKKKIEVRYGGRSTFLVTPVEGKNRDHPASIDAIKKVLLGVNAKSFDSPPYSFSYIKAIVKYIEDEYKISKNVEQKPYVESYVLIIDEINRGNISRIFGELITLIEPSKRAGEKDALSVTLPYSGDSFSVPKNLYIIGTMNTADRSIALLDTALRRRFRFEEMMPNPALLDGVIVEDVNISELLSTINARIEALYDRDHQIGHTYFLPLQETPTLKMLSEIFRYSIMPLLQEYFYDDWEKIDKTLNRNGFLKVFDPPGDLDSDKKVWRINEGAFDNADNYKKIYNGV